MKRGEARCSDRSVQHRRRCALPRRRVHVVERVQQRRVVAQGSARRGGQRSSERVRLRDRRRASHVDPAARVRGRQRLRLQRARQLHARAHLPRRQRQTKHLRKGGESVSALRLRLRGPMMQRTRRMVSDRPAPARSRMSSSQASVSPDATAASSSAAGAQSEASAEPAGMRTRFPCVGCVAGRRVRAIRQPGRVAAAQRLGRRRQP
jgi:hypothetical protein